MLAIALVLSAALAPSPSRSAGPPSLASLVDSSTLICIGTVDRVETVAFPDGIKASLTSGGKAKEVTFGRIRVERVVVGDPATTVAYHEAWPSWTCDATHAAVGVRSIFFLGPGVIAKASDQDRALAETTLGSKLILRSQGDTSGMPGIERNEHGDYFRAAETPLGIRMPGVDGCVHVEAATTYIHDLARFAPNLCTIRARRDRGEKNSGHGFDLRVLPDGQRRIAIRFFNFEKVTMDRVPEVEWQNVRQSLSGLVGTNDETVGVSYQSSDRSLWLRFGGAKFEWWRNDDKPNPVDLNRESNGGFARGLRAWSIMRGLLNCDICADDREADQKLIEELTRK